MIIAIVGSREITKETFEEVREFAKKIALEGNRVVSGGARGVDHAALLGALEAGSVPVAVIPTIPSRQPRIVRPVLKDCEVIEHVDRSDFIGAIHDRNQEIVAGADKIVIFTWGSPGSRSYIRYANKIGKAVQVHRVPFLKGDVDD